jgi:hypothetical protein
MNEKNYIYGRLSSGCWIFFLCWEVAAGAELSVWLEASFYKTDDTMLQKYTELSERATHPLKPPILRRKKKRKTKLSEHICGGAFSHHLLHHSQMFIYVGKILSSC